MENNLDPKPLTEEQTLPDSTPPQQNLGGPFPVLEVDAAEDEDDESPSASGRSRKWMIVGGLLVVFLAAAVFLGARLLKPPSAAGSKQGGEMFISSKGGPGGAKSVRLNMTPAKELPQEQPAQAGLFVRREDQSIFIGTGNITIMARKPNGASSPDDVSSKYDGPVIEVVINHQTKVYHDVTEMPEPDKAKDGVVTAQQVVEPGSLDDIGSNGQVTVWGEKQGDRIVADVLLYR